MKAIMNIEVVPGQEPKQTTKLKNGKLKLPKGSSGELLYVGENNGFLHCFVVESGAYYGVVKSKDPKHIYHEILRLNT